MRELGGSSELTEWMAYHRLDPFGPERDDLRIGMAAAPIINMLSGKRSKRIKPDDFVLSHRKLRPEQGWEQIKAALKSFTKAVGGVIKKKPSGE